VATKQLLCEMQKGRVPSTTLQIATLCALVRVRVQGKSRITSNRYVKKPFLMWIQARHIKLPKVERGHATLEDSKMLSVPKSRHRRNKHIIYSACAHTITYGT